MSRATPRLDQKITNPMKTFKVSCLLPSAALALALVGAVSATTITSGGHLVTNEGMMTTQAGATTTTFDGLTLLPTGFTASGTTPSNPLVSHSSNGVYAAPANDTSTFLTTGSGSITDHLAAGTTYLGFYWGSIDNYNTLSLTESNGTVLSYTGATVASAAGLDADGNHSYFVNFFANPGVTFTSATFGASRNSFEFDNVASATPEPGTVAMLAGGLLIVAGTFRRRRKA